MLVRVSKKPRSPSPLGRGHVLDAAGRGRVVWGGAGRRSRRRGSLAGFFRFELARCISTPCGHAPPLHEGITTAPPQNYSRPRCCSAAIHGLQGDKRLGWAAIRGLQGGGGPLVRRRQQKSGCSSPSISLRRHSPAHRCGRKAVAWCGAPRNTGQLLSRSSGLPAGTVCILLGRPARSCALHGKSLCE